jgi:hypothetical protein
MSYIRANVTVEHNIGVSPSKPFSSYETPFFESERERERDRGERFSSSLWKILEIF